LREAIGRDLGIHEVTKRKEKLEEEGLQVHLTSTIVHAIMTNIARKTSIGSTLRSANYNIEGYHNTDTLQIETPLAACVAAVH
jgi:hypothetical protein